MSKPFSGYNFIDALLSNSGYGYSPVLSWAQTLAQPVTLTYDFMTTAPGDTPGSNFQQFPTAMRDNAVAAMAAISEVANVRFVRDPSGTANIEFGLANLGSSGNTVTTGLAITTPAANGTATYYTQASVWLTNQSGNTYSTAPGTDGFATLIHEIAHAIGLDHPFDGAYVLPTSEDSQHRTVMSYTEYTYGRYTPEVHPQTPMIYDIGALQYLYGANMTTRTGNDTYTFSELTHPETHNLMMTIWDAGGNDTIVGYGTINLNPGSASFRGQVSYEGHIYVHIAYGVVIENAIGTQGLDTIIGNSAGNFIAGGFWSVDAGGDRMDGGDGFDTVSWNHVPVGVTLNLVNNSLNAGGAYGDTVANFEAYLLTPFADVFFGNATGSFVYAYAGADQIFGSLESDFIDAGPGGDYIDGNAGFDYASYNTSTLAVLINRQNPALNTGDAAGDIHVNVEAFVLSEFDDIFISTSGGNFAFGYGGNDQFYGAVSSNDWFFGGGGNDIISGGSLNDLLSGGDGADTYVFLDDATNGFDSILDFTTGVDRFAVDDVGFGLITGQILINGFNFISSAAPLPVAALATFLYNTSNGILSFDADGTGGGALTPLAQILGAPTVASSDFMVI